MNLFMPFIKKNPKAYPAIGMEEYFIPMRDGDFDDAILNWQYSCQVYNITMIVEPLPDNSRLPPLDPKKWSTPLSVLTDKQPCFKE